MTKLNPATHLKTLRFRTQKFDDLTLAELKRLYSAFQRLRTKTHGIDSERGDRSHIYLCNLGERHIPFLIRTINRELCVGDEEGLSLNSFNNIWWERTGNSTFRAPMVSNAYRIKWINYVLRKIDAEIAKRRRRK